jgi:tryptophan synthase alpha chain
MAARDRISTAIDAAVAQGRPALVGFLADFTRNLAEVASVCDVVEIGVPFSDPMADGSTIQRASFAALGNGVTLRWILDDCRAPPPPRGCRASSCPICPSRRART